ncbi:MAG: MOSC domain-containing protein [Akkermansiaceae bacterium]
MEDQEHREPGKEGAMMVSSIQVGKPAAIADGSNKKEWVSGILKRPVDGEVCVGETNISGDGQADLKVHGGPDKAICVYPSEHFAYWKEVLDVEFEAGAFGENLTTTGVVEEDICIGDIYSLGTVRLQVSQPRQPCWKLARRWKLKDLPARVQDTGKTGWYFRVLKTGEIAPGDHLVMEQRVTGGWSVARANEVMHHQKSDLTSAVKLAAHEGLSESWRKSLTRRAEKLSRGAANDVDESAARLFGGGGVEGDGA